MKSKKNLIIIVLIMLISALGITYAFFYYNRISDEQHEIIAGEIYLKLIDGKDSISLINIFPETVEEARSRTDNVLTFNITGKNTTLDQDVYYEIMLNEDADIAGKTRFKPEHIRFDLTEIVNGKKTLVVDNMSFNNFDAKRIWVNTVTRETTTELNITYELRMWLSDDILISDTNTSADYNTETFKNSYANVKVSVYGDFIEKSVPYNYMNNSFGTEISDLKANIKEIQFVSMEKSKINERVSNATIKYDVTNTSKSKAGSVMAWLEEDELVTNDDDTTIQYYKMYVASDGITFFPISVSNMFNSYTAVTTINFENVDTRYVTNVSRMFNGCSNLTSLNLNSWDVSSVTNMSYMFYNCKTLTSLNLDSWDVSSVNNMSNMFYYCSSLTSLDLNDWDVSSVNNMSNVFYYCSSLTSLDINDWDVSSVANMNFMFRDCSSLTSLDISNWDVSGVTVMSAIFDGCSSLTSLDLNNWDISGVTNMSSLFSGCEGLTNLDINDWNVSGIANMSFMFWDCSSLTSLDISNWDVSGVTDMKWMFNGCSSLTTIYVDLDWQELTTKLEDSESMFYNCKKLVGAVSYDSTKTDITMANPDTGYFTSKTA